MRMEVTARDDILEIFVNAIFRGGESMIVDDDDDAVEPPLPPPLNCSNTDTVLYEC